MPFAEDRGGIAARLEQVRERDLVGVQAGLRARPERALDADAVRVASRQQRCARRRAHRLRNVEIGEAHALAGEPVEVRRRTTLLP